MENKNIDKIEQPQDKIKLDLKYILNIIKQSGIHSIKIFLIIVGIRGTFNILLKSLTNRGKGLKLSDIYNKDIRNSGLFFSNFILSWNTLSRVLPFYIKDKKYANFLSGFLSGAFVLWERKDRRISFSHQLSMRAAQSIYHSLYSKNLLRIPYGDVILFTFSTAQILYSYVMQFETLDPSIYKFMIRHALIPHSILQINRKIVRGQKIDVDHLTDLVEGMNVTAENLDILKNLDDSPITLPCKAYHPNITSCNYTLLNRLILVFKMISPIYAGLTFLPAIFLRFNNFKRSPSEILKRCFYGTIRSSAFLAILVSTYQFMICNAHALQTKYNIKDNKYIYYFAGIISGLASVLVEKPSRRAELALYTTPKALDSFYHILYKKDWIFYIPHFESFLFMIASGITMMYFKKEPETISPLLKWLLIRFIGKNTK
ncbi:hypothetical protein K502DRAFT_365263 [Neoconidiobolus thromboides FSU 785]|nr:hypothetical protein K502DRAFT_365263 [Neoconidiobolus thromboides FSU 785]